jgi:hypothetical protein
MNHYPTPASLPSAFASPQQRALLTDALAIPELKDLIGHVAHSKQVHSDMVLTNIFGAVNTAINGKFLVKTAAGQVESAQLYFLLIAPPGARKSSVVSFAKAPILEAAKAEQDAGGLPTRHYFEDATPTALKRALAESGGCLACHSAEPELLKAAQSRAYPKPLLCGGYDGEQINLDRSKEDPIIISDPAIALCVSAQPEMALEFARNDGVRDSGLRGRFLFVNFPSNAGTRYVGAPSIPREATEYYHHMIQRLLKLSRRSDGSRHVLVLSPDAELRYLQFAREAETALQAGQPLSFDHGWGSKLPGKVLRLAAILHCVQHEVPCSTPIDDMSMSQAIRMGYGFAIYAQEFFLRADFGEAEDTADAILAWATKLGIKTFDAKDVRGALPHFSTKLVQAGIDQLLKSHRIQEDFLSYGSQLRPGRRGRNLAPRYVVVWLPGYGG